MKAGNIVLDKSFSFAVRTVNIYKALQNGQEYTLSKQLLRSGTSIGANIREALRGQSRNDFISKMNIALKEAYETEYWLELLHATGYLDKPQFDDAFAECRDLTNILSKIIISSRRNDNV
ncbi:MAG: four helix bundle protein [Alistipes sp.]|nr:four helix bundle protein [Alistipes sp.]